MYVCVFFRIWTLRVLIVASLTPVGSCVGGSLLGFLLNAQTRETLLFSVTVVADFGLCCICNDAVDDKMRSSTQRRLFRHKVGGKGSRRFVSRTNNRLLLTSSLLCTNRWKKVPPFDQVDNLELLKYEVLKIDESVLAFSSGAGGYEYYYNRCSKSA